MIGQAHKPAYDFVALFAQDGITAIATACTRRRLLPSGGSLPCVTRRTVSALTSIVDGTDIWHCPAAGVVHR